MAQSSAQAQDPYFIAKEQLSKRIKGTQDTFGKWKALFDAGATSSSNAEFGTLLKNLQADIKAVNIDVSNLQKVINVVQINRLRFPKITDEDLDQRKRFVADVKVQVDRIDEFMSTPRVKNRIHADKLQALTGTGPAPGSASAAAAAAGSAAGAVGGMAGRGGERSGKAEAAMHVEARRANVKAMEAREDAVLQSMGEVLVNLDRNTRVISTSLTEQKQTLEEIDGTMTQTQGLMGTTLTKMDVLLKKSKTGRLCCMFLLFILAVVLLALIIYV